MEMLILKSRNTVEDGEQFSHKRVKPSHTSSRKVSGGQGLAVGRVQEEFLQ